jgi:hypothetical protein
MAFFFVDGNELKFRRIELSTSWLRSGSEQHREARRREPFLLSRRPLWRESPSAGRAPQAQTDMKKSARVGLSGMGSRFGVTGKGPS